MKTLETRSVAFAALLTAAGSAAGLALALLAQHAFDLAPCPLCLEQRWPYYIGVPLALVVTVMAQRHAPQIFLQGGVAVLVLVMGWSLFLAVQHSGVEWGWWAAPGGCKASGQVTIDVSDLFAQLKVDRPVPCDAPSWRLFGLLSFANLNAVLSGMILILNAGVLAGYDPRRLWPYGSSTVSQ